MNKYIILTLSNQPVYTLGDLHGDFDSLLRNIKKHNISDCILIICGDIGIGFSNIKYHQRKFNELNDALKELNITLLCFRGNHDDPSYFNREIIDTNKEQDFWLSNFKLLPDYSVIKINGKSILTIGGATSIDRLGRKMNDRYRIKSFIDFYPNLTQDEAKEILPPTYWSDEAPVFNADLLDKITEDGILITHVLTHTCPSFAFPRDKRGIKEWMKYDLDLEKTLFEERDVMDKIYNYLIDKFHPIEEWVYGHYHTHFQEDINGVRFTTLINIDYKFDSYEITRNDIEEYNL